MSSTAITNSTLVDVIVTTPSNSAVRSIVLAVAGSLLLTLTAKIQIPFFPVPLTLQTLGVLVIGMAFGAKLAGATLVLYLAEGALGLPVFAGTPEKGIGLAYMVGPTGGYLLGFLIAAVACGWLAQKGWDRNMLSTAVAMLIGNILIYVPGLLWLGQVVGWDKPVLQWGLTPFLLGDLTKLIIAALLLPAVWRFIGKR